MKSHIRSAIIVTLSTLPLSACLLSSNGGSSTQQQNTVLVSEIISICGAMVGDQAEQRINQEWSKYPEASANRPIIEAVAETLLNDPNSSQQRTSEYKKYLSCATGLLMANGFVK